MAKIDLKFATLYIRDGYAQDDTAGAVNNALGYAANATTMTVDGFTDAVVTGDYFVMAADPDQTRHKITSHTETLGATTSITFTPGLAAAVLDNAVINLLPHEIEVKIGEGTLTYDEKRNMEYTLDRGRLDTVREGDEVPMEIKLDFTWEFIRAVTGSGTPTVEEALKKIGEASAWESSSDDACEPYAVDLQLEYIPDCAADGYETFLFPDFRWESLAHDAKAGTVSVTGKCNATQATITRVAGS